MLSMAQLAAALPYVALASTALTVYNQYEQGRYQSAMSSLQAAERDADANAAQAESQRVALIERRKAKNLSSRARALMAASGGSASDPTAVNIITDIETQGELNALNALYSGDTMARGLRTGGSVARNEAEAYRAAANLRAASTALDGGTTWFSKYGA
jgi:hypothetical protein